MPPRYKPSKTAAAFEKFKNAINPEKMFRRARSAPKARSIYVNTPLPESMFDKKGRVPKADLYATNQSITSKYTVITFVPRNLFEQVSRSCLWRFQGGREGREGRRGGGGQRRSTFPLSSAFSLLVRVLLLALQVTIICIRALISTWMECPAPRKAKGRG